MADVTYSGYNGWSFDCPADGTLAPPGGIVLRAVTHDGHNFAKSLRLAGLWIELQDTARDGTAVHRWKVFHPLDAAFDASPIRILSPQPVRSWWPTGDLFALEETQAALQFAAHLRQGGGLHSFGVSARYAAPQLFESHANCDRAGLVVEQLSLFSPYSDSPRHEPSGALKAARCFPMVRYQLTPNRSFNPSRQSVRIASIRFDYRLHLYLDAHHATLRNDGLEEVRNQAGFFADGDSFRATVARGARSASRSARNWLPRVRYWALARGAPRGTAVAAAVFDAAEKPVVLEATAPGLGHGFPVFDAVAADGSSAAVRAWDNVHWWGARGAGQPLVSTPGAFHCAHLHWRWGGALKVSPVALSSTFNPDTYPAGMEVPKEAEGMWGPLVDPGIFVQTLRLAVMKNHPHLDPDRGAAAASLSTEQWNDAFERGIPEDISDGADIVLWYSIEVMHVLDPAQGAPPEVADFKPADGGSIFIHGIFFAHDAEQKGLLVGTTGPIHAPVGKQAIQAATEWFRPAQRF